MQFLPPVFSPLSHRYYDREVLYRQTDFVQHFIYIAEDWESVLATVYFVLLRLRKSKLHVITRSLSHRGKHTNSEYCHLQLCPVKMQFKLQRVTLLQKTGALQLLVYLQPLLCSSGKEQTELFQVLLQSDEDRVKGSGTDIQNRLHTVRAKQGRFILAQSGKSELVFQEQNVLICLYDCKKSAFAERKDKLPKPSVEEKGNH